MASGHTWNSVGGAARPAFAFFRHACTDIAVPHAIFLRAVNVGGHRRMSVAEIAKKLGLRNVGAAGTFVSNDARSAVALRKALAAELQVATDILIVPSEDLLALMTRAPLADETGKSFVTILAKAPEVSKLPVEAKGVRLVATDGVFALSVVLPSAKPGADVNGLVERTLGVAGTTRGWPTMEKVAKLLEDAA